MFSLKAISALEGKLLLAGFLDAQRIQLKSVVPAEVASFGVSFNLPYIVDISFSFYPLSCMNLGLCDMIRWNCH